MGYKILFREWRLRRWALVLMVVEIPSVVPMLVLFALANPDLYRTLFWQIGYDNGWNSDPNMIIYAYANHVPLPTVPFVWSQNLTTFNVAISVTSLFVLLVKMIGFIMHLWYPLVGLFFNFALMALYATSIYGQAGPDYADPQQPSPVAWYIARGCAPATPYGGYSQCIMAKATFGLTIWLLFLYVAGLAIAVYSMLPNKALDEETGEDDYFPSQKKQAGDNWEMESRPPFSPRSQAPMTPRSPFTPRTQAFHTLDRRLPLRQS